MALLWNELILSEIRPRAPVSRGWADDAEGPDGAGSSFFPSCRFSRAIRSESVVGGALDLQPIPQSSQEQPSGDIRVEYPGSGSLHLRAWEHSGGHWREMMRKCQREQDRRQKQPKCDRKKREEGEMDRGCIVSSDHE